jgi:hypothetical protein
MTHSPLIRPVPAATPGPRQAGARRSIPAVPLCCCAALLLFPAACSSTSKPVPYARIYPAEPSRAQTLNIQVFRTTKRLELTNTTARQFGPSRLWLNAWFSRPIDGLNVGQSLDLPLKEFRDEFSGAFRGGGFFATEAPERLVLAELETMDQDGKPEFLRLVVVGGDEE